MAAIDFFDRGWSMDPSKVAYRGVGEVWTYEQAGRLSCRIANRLLAEAGSGKATVAVLSPNLPTAWICVLGVWRADCTWVPPESPTIPWQRTRNCLCASTWTWSCTTRTSHRQ